MIPKESEVCDYMKALGATYLGMSLNGGRDPYDYHIDCEPEQERRNRKLLARVEFMYGKGITARVYSFEMPGEVVEMPYGLKQTTEVKEPEGKRSPHKKSTKMKYSETMRHT